MVAELEAKLEEIKEVHNLSYQNIKCVEINLDKAAGERCLDFLISMKHNKKMSDYAWSLGLVSGFKDNELVYKVVRTFENYQPYNQSESEIVALIAEQKDKELLINVVDFLDRNQSASIGGVIESFKLAMLAGDNITKMIEFFDKHMNHKYLKQISKGFACSLNLEFKVAEDMIEMYETYIDKDIPLITDTIYHRAQITSDAQTRSIVPKVLAKYHDNHYKILCDVIMNNRANWNTFFTELLRSATYREIQNSRQPEKLIKNLLTNNYTFRKFLAKEYRDELKYTDLDLVGETYCNIIAIHRERIDYWPKLDYGYYRELNRSMRQSNTIEGARKMLKQYCYEVKKQLNDNLLELMYVGS